MTRGTKTTILSVADKAYNKEEVAKIIGRRCCPSDTNNKGDGNESRGGNHEQEVHDQSNRNEAEEEETRDDKDNDANKNEEVVGDACGERCDDGLRKTLQLGDKRNLSNANNKKDGEYENVDDLGVRTKKHRPESRNENSVPDNAAQEGTETTKSKPATTTTTTTTKMVSTKAPTKQQKRMMACEGIALQTGDGLR